METVDEDDHETSSSSPTTTTSTSSLPTSKRPEVKKYVPEWLAHRNKMLQAASGANHKSGRDPSGHESTMASSQKPKATTPKPDSPEDDAVAAAAYGFAGKSSNTSKANDDEAAAAYGFANNKRNKKVEVSDAVAAQAYGFANNMNKSDDSDDAAAAAAYGHSAPATNHADDEGPAEKSVSSSSNEDPEVLNSFSRSLSDIGSNYELNSVISSNAWSTGTSSHTEELIDDEHASFNTTESSSMEMISDSNASEENDSQKSWNRGPPSPASLGMKSGGRRESWATGGVESIEMKSGSNWTEAGVPLSSSSSSSSSPRGEGGMGTREMFQKLIEFNSPPPPTTPLTDESVSLASPAPPLYGAALRRGTKELVLSKHSQEQQSEILGSGDSLDHSSNPSEESASLASSAPLHGEERRAAAAREIRRGTRPPVVVTTSEDAAAAVHTSSSMDDSFHPTTHSEESVSLASSAPLHGEERRKAAAALRRGTRPPVAAVVTDGGTATTGGDALEPSPPPPTTGDSEAEESVSLASISSSAQNPQDDVQTKTEGAKGGEKNPEPLLTNPPEPKPFRILSEEEENEKIEEDAGNDNLSCHSVASFWGNSLRFEDPMRKKEPNTQETIMHVGDPDINNQEIGQASRAQQPWNNGWMPPNTDSHHQEEKSEQPDPPAALDGNLRNGSGEMGENLPRKKRIKKKRQRQPSEWMPPVSHNPDSTTNDDDSDDEVESLVTATIAETMKRLSSSENAPSSTENSATKAKGTDGEAYRGATLPSRSTATATSNASAYRRIDFAGQQILSQPYISGSSHHGDDTTVSSGSSSVALRRYYDHGRRKRTNEKMRSMYMPTLAPSLRNLHTHEEELFDWVPQRSRACEIPHAISKHEDAASSHASTSYEVVSTQRDDTISHDIDIESNRGIEEKSEPGSPLYTEHTIQEASPKINFESRDVAINDVGKEDRQDRGMDTDLMESDDPKALDEASAKESTGIIENDTNHSANKPKHCVNYLLCLMIILIPGLPAAILFGIRFPFSEWF